MSWVDVTTAIGTAGAAIVALGLGLRGIYLDRLRKRDEELRQARLVMVSEPFFIDATSEHDRGVAVTVYNYSDEPIHDVSVGIDIRRGDNRDDSTPPEYEDGVNWDFLAPREKREIVFDVPREGGISVGSSELRFLDSSGRRFERHATQAEPQRILHDPQLVVQHIDGEVNITTRQQEGRIKAIISKMNPWKAASNRQ